MIADITHASVVPYICGVFVVRSLRLHRALHRCVLQGTAPRPGFGFPALPVLHCGTLLFFLGLGFLQLPIRPTSDIYTPFIYGSTYDLQRSKTYFFFFFFLFYRRIQKPLALSLSLFYPPDAFPTSINPV